MRSTDDDIAAVRHNGFERLSSWTFIRRQAEADFRTGFSKLDEIAVSQRGFRLSQSVHRQLAMPGSVANDRDAVFDRKICVVGTHRSVTRRIKLHATSLTRAKPDGVGIELLRLPAQTAAQMI